MLIQVICIYRYMYHYVYVNTEVVYFSEEDYEFINMIANYLST